MRRRGDVFWFNFDYIGRHQVVVVSRNTGRDTVIVAFITDPEEEPPEAPDVITVAGMSCHGHVKGFVRCDQLFNLDKDDGAWGAQVTHMIGDDMRKVEAGLRAALRL